MSGGGPCVSATRGRSNWAHPVNGQRGQTHRRLDAGEPDAAEGLGFRPPATIWTVETTGAEPALVRVIWSKRERRGWPELVGIELEASAGARCVRQLRLEQAGEQNEQRGSNYVRVRVCWVGHCD